MQVERQRKQKQKEKRKVGAERKEEHVRKVEEDGGRPTAVQEGAKHNEGGASEGGKKGSSKSRAQTFERGRAGGGRGRRGGENEGKQGRARARITVGRDEHGRGVGRSVGSRREMDGAGEGR